VHDDKPPAWQAAVDVDVVNDIEDEVVENIFLRIIRAV
jgi:hypothetical protein